VNALLGVFKPLKIGCTSAGKIAPGDISGFNHSTGGKVWNTQEASMDKKYFFIVHS